MLKGGRACGARGGAMGVAYFFTHARTHEHMHASGASAVPLRSRSEEQPHVVYRRYTKYCMCTSSSPPRSYSAPAAAGVSQKTSCGEQDQLAAAANLTEEQARQLREKHAAQLAAAGGGRVYGEAIFKLKAEPRRCVDG